jgi:hypothetical protein
MSQPNITQLSTSLEAPQKRKGSTIVSEVQKKMETLKELYFFRPNYTKYIHITK